MTNPIETDFMSAVDGLNITTTLVGTGINCNKNRQHKHVLKSKRNLHKHKCNKLLKRKLKKYKLRQDGRDDPDVLDVSKTLASSLLIKSPNNLKESLLKEEDLTFFDDIRPKNYLFKMVRRKDAIKKRNGFTSPPSKANPNDSVETTEKNISYEKKHTNAFQLLMDSRNKSIGSNSPGKDKSDDESNDEEILKKKNTKVKRNLALQKMAEAKGYLKNKEIEEYQDKIIKRKMDKRAERLKIMILKETKPAILNKDFDSKKIIETEKVNQSDKITVINNNVTNKTRRLKIVDIFNTLSDPINISPEKKLIPKEDKEFLNKLSPSLKKKESMLSYFKKVDKELSPVDSENDNLIKVKLQIKPKKKSKKKKLSLKRDTDLNSVALDEVNDENNQNNFDSNTPVLEVNSVGSESSVANNTTDRQKRKRKDKTHSNHVDDTAMNSENRPKRAVKRPTKYTDDTYLTSSDEELRVFTPKKKKHIESVSNVKVETKPKSDDEPHKPNIEKKAAKESNLSKKPVKLAPIFAAKQLDSAALEAKQKFLQSGVPDKLKKIINQQKNNSTVSSDFPVVVHIQQSNSNAHKILPPIQNILGSDDVDLCTMNLANIKEDAYKTLLNLDVNCHSTIIDNNLVKSTQAILQNIKKLHPKFPVYRTYRYLRCKKKGEHQECNNDFDNSIEVMNDVADVITDSPDKLNWTDKYKAMSTNQIIGNFESIKELRKWLISWTENEIKSKSRGVNAGSDSSDYYQSDTDSRDSLKTVNNLLILTGPTGCGKTSSVYTVAAELAMKVIEVNASSKRTGKIMMQDLQEATQSHKVNRGAGSTDNSQKSQEKNLTELLKKNKKRGRPKKSTEHASKKISDKIEVLNSTPSSQESSRTDSSLILIDDADIVFDQDDGFSSAIVQLVQSSKRPVILITSSLVCPHLQRFFNYAKVLHICPLLPRLLGTWLDIMCLADTGLSWPGTGAKFLNYFKGDIRKTVNYLQYFISSCAHNSKTEEEIVSQNVDYNTHIDDENSSMSWAENDYLESKKFTSSYDNNGQLSCIWKSFIEKQSNLSIISYPLPLFNIWWSVPRLLSKEANISNTIRKVNKAPSITEKRVELDVIADVLDAISLSDHIMHTHPSTCSDITSKPWYSSENNSVSEQDNLDYYMNNCEIGNEICCTLMTKSISTAQDFLNCDKNMDLSFPGMSQQRKRDKVVSRHKSLTSYLNPWAVLDRRSLAVDYWSSCRTICRLEKSKSDANVNMKRNNRFCHYLKSLNVLCKSETFDNLCDSLSDQGTELNICNSNEW